MIFSSICVHMHTYCIYTLHLCIQYLKLKTTLTLCIFNLFPKRPGALTWSFDKPIPLVSQGTSNKWSIASSFAWHNFCKQKNSAHLCKASSFGINTWPNDVNGCRNSTFTPTLSNLCVRHGDARCFRRTPETPDVCISDCYSPLN